MARKLHPDCVPGAEDAVIDDSKLLLYALNPDHPQGGPKARFFAAIGYTRDDYEALRDAILEAFPTVQGFLSRTREDGCEHWEAAITVRRLDIDETAEIITVWEVAEDAPTRLITTYPM